ncbi:hypothetical protein [Vibrio sp. SCSIO 43136]|uniref:hypothetical protein n=1 Tax=Vibrio sp. SCSIO 43136 TaxID=2819101 RepID=UPI0020756D32|nr:hypothetical protein [Vibrio sp. SCSIO 43136]USD66463.1 hypothetical protein J4N39_06550 [Vibrio sp. SCSIO 43136]
MKKLFAAAAILASTSSFAVETSQTQEVSRYQGLNLNVLAGADSNAGPTIAAEIGLGSAFAGYQMVGDIDSRKVIDANEQTPDGFDFTRTQKDSVIYAGYNFDNGFSVKGGFAMTSVEGKFEGEEMLNTAFRPMVGLGYTFSNSVNVNLHVSSGQEVDFEFENSKLSELKTYEFETNAAIMVGYRF